MHIGGTGTITTSAPVKCGQFFSGLEYASAGQLYHAGQYTAAAAAAANYGPNQYDDRNTNSVHRCERLYLLNSAHQHHRQPPPPPPAFGPAIAVGRAATVGYRDQPTTTTAGHRPPKLSAYIAQASGQDSNNISCSSGGGGGQVFHGVERMRYQASSISLPPFSRVLGCAGRDALLRPARHIQSITRGVACCGKHDQGAQDDAAARRGMVQGFHGPDGCAALGDEGRPSLPRHDWQQQQHQHHHAQGDVATAAAVTGGDRCRATSRPITEPIHRAGGGPTGGGGTSNEFYIEINLR